MTNIISAETMDALIIMSIIETIREASEGGVFPLTECTLENRNNSIFFK